MVGVVVVGGGSGRDNPPRMFSLESTGERQRWRRRDATLEI